MTENQAALLKLKALGYPLVNIRKAILALDGKTQSDIARTLEINRTFVTNIIIGRKHTARWQRAIALLLEVEADEFFEDER